MGRWKGHNNNKSKDWKNKKADYSNGATTNGGNNNSNNNNLWSFKEQKQVIAYLTEYRKAAERVYHGSCHVNATAKAPAVIGDIVFPALTDAAVSEPYLTLSMALSSKRRKAIHEFCVDVGLYHGSIGTVREDRVLIISIFADGFQHAVGLEKPAHASMFIIERYRPWYCRHQNQTHKHVKVKGGGDLTPTRSNSSRSSSTRATSTSAGSTTQQSQPWSIDAETLARQCIDRLIDQPGDCLRDNRDMLDFTALEKDDLSNIAPPGTGKSQDATDSTSNMNDNWMLVDTADKMMQCIAELEAAAPSEIAFDVESYNKSKYTQLTCLLQITSTAGKEYVIDTLAEDGRVWDKVGGLRKLFGDPNIVKIGHSIGGLDVRSLHRDFGIFIVNAFDTYESAMILGLKAHGLAKVCEHYGITEGETYERLKASYQASDWRIRPLTAPMIQYGRYDIRYLIKLRTLMMRDLTKSELWDKDVTDKEAEGRLVASSLAATLQRIHELEDERPAVCADNDNGNDNDNDNDDFQSTTGEEARMDSITDLYSTPQGSIRSLDCSELETVEVVVTDDNDNDAIAMSQVNVNVVGAKELRLQPRLMRVMSRSQDRCKDLWKNQAEPHLKNAVFQSVTRGKKREIDLTAFINLYDDLVQFRDSVAISLECLPGFVAPLDLLVQIAYKRPTTEYSLRKITHFLPELLEGPESQYREQLLTIVRKSLEKQGVDPDADIVFLYANRQVQQVREREVEGDDVAMRRTQIAWKVVVAAVVGAGVALAVVVAKRRRTR
jgi:ribonuclease D